MSRGWLRGPAEVLMGGEMLAGTLRRTPGAIFPIGLRFLFSTL